MRVGKIRCSFHVGASFNPVISAMPRTNEVFAAQVINNRVATEAHHLDECRGLS